MINDNLINQVLCSTQRRTFVHDQDFLFVDAPIEF